MNPHLPKKKTNPSIRLPKPNSNALQISQNDSSASTSKSSKITKSISSGVLKTKSAINKTKSSKPDTSVKQTPESPTTQNIKNSSIKRSASVSKIIETSQSSSASSTKSSEITKHCRSDGTKIISKTNKTKASKPVGSFMEVIETPSTRDNDSSPPLHTSISDTPSTSQCSESPSITKLSEKDNEVKENKAKILKLVTTVEPDTKSSSIHDENNSSIKLPTVISNNFETSQSNITTSVTNLSKIKKPCISGAVKDDSATNKTTIDKNKSSKPDESNKQMTNSPSPQDRDDSSIKLTTINSNNQEISLKKASNLTIKSSKSTKSSSSDVENTKSAINITKSSKTEKQVSRSSLTRNKIISPIKPPKKTTNTVKNAQNIANKDGKNTTANIKKKITCSTIPSLSDEPKKLKPQAHRKLSKLDFTNIVLLADERDNDLKNVSFPCVKWIIKKDMSPVTAFSYIKEHFQSTNYKGKTLYIMMCGIKSLYDIGQDYNMCDQYNCKYPIRYWELAGQNARFASNRLIENSRKLREKVKMVSNTKDDVVFSGIVPICLQNIFVSDVKEHSVWSPYHQIPNDDTVHAAFHQLDIAGWKAIIFYNEWANKFTSELKIQLDIEKDFFSNNSKQKHFMKSKTLDKDGYHLCNTAVSIRKENLMDAVENCLTKMGIEKASIDLQKYENIKSQKNSKGTNETKKGEPKSNSKATENQDYFLDFDGDRGNQTRNILKCANNYMHVVLLCDERDENLQNVMLNLETKIIFKKGLGMHDAFKEIKTHPLFGKGTLFIMLCGIQTVCNVNFRNQVQILGENSKNITKQLIVNAKQLQESVLTTSGGWDNVIFTGIIPVEYRSMSRMAKRDLLIACLKYNEWASSQRREMKCSHWDIVKYWFMLSNEADNDLKLAIKENTIVQDDLSFTQQAKLYRQNVIKEAIAKTRDEKNLNKNIDPSIVKEDLRILLKSRKIEIDDQLRNKNDKIKYKITSRTPSLQVATHGEPFSIPFEKVVIVGNVHYKSLLKKLSMDIPQMEVLADSSYNFHKDLKTAIEYIEKHKYIGLSNTLWILTSDVSCITQRESHSSCQYYGCRTPISYLNTDVRWYTEGEEKAKILMRNEAQRISNSGKRFRDKMRKLFDDSCAVVLCPPLPATVYISPYALKENNAHPQLHNALSYFVGFENDVDIIEQSFLEPLMHFYSNFNMEWLNLACDVLLEENMCSSNLVEYKGIQGNSIQVMSLQMDNESYKTWINIMSEIICSALTKPKIRTGAQVPTEVVKAHTSVPVNSHTSVPAELQYDTQNYTPVVNSENKRTSKVACHLEKPVLQDMDTEIPTSPQEMNTHFQSIALIGSKKNSKLLHKLVNHNVKFVVGRLNFDEKSDEFILYQQNNFEGATLWVCLVDFLRLTCLVDASLCERDRHCMQPTRILNLKYNEENEVNKAEKFVSRMIPKLNKGSAIILAPLAPSQVVLESYFKNHSYIHSFREKSEVPIIVGDKVKLMKHLGEYEKNWLTMIHSVCCCQKVLGNYENALEEYCKYKGPLVDIIESQYLYHKAEDEWKEFIEALLIYFKELKVMEGNGSLSDGKISLDNSRMENRTTENEQVSSTNEICETVLLNKSNTDTNSLITNAISCQMKKNCTDATCVPKSSEEGIVTEKLVNPNLSRASKIKIVKPNKEIVALKILSNKTDTKSLVNSSIVYTNESHLNNSKDLESSKEELNKRDKKCLENFSIENRNNSILDEKKDFKNTEGLVKDSRLKTKIISKDTHFICPLGEIIVPKETLINSIGLDNSTKQIGKQLNDAANNLDKDEKKNSQQLNIFKPETNLDTLMTLISNKSKATPSVEDNTSTTDNKVSEMNYSIHEIKEDGKKHANKSVSNEKVNVCEIKESSDKSQTQSTQLDNTKNLLKSDEPSDLHKNTPTKLCTVNMTKDSDKEREILSKSKPLNIKSKYSSTVETIDTSKVKVSSNEQTKDTSKVKVSSNDQTKDTSKVKVSSNEQTKDTSKVKVSSNEQTKDTSKVKVSSNEQTKDTSKMKVSSNVETRDTSKMKVSSNVETRDTSKVKVSSNDQTKDTSKVKVSSKEQTKDTSKVKVSGIHESINDEVMEKLLKACGPIIMFKRNMKGSAEVMCDSMTAARVARIFNHRTVNNKTLQAWLIKDSSKGKESHPKLTDIEESFEDREAIKKIEEILKKLSNILPLKFQPRSLSLPTSTSPAVENTTSTPKIINSTPTILSTSIRATYSKDSGIGVGNNISSNDNATKIKTTKENIVKSSSESNSSNEDLKILKKIKQHLLGSSTENEYKVNRLVIKECHKNDIVTAEEVSGDCSLRVKNKSLLENEGDKKDEKNKSSKNIRHKRKEEVNIQETISSDISSNQDFEEELLQVEKKVEKRKNAKDNHNDRIFTNKQSIESSVEKKVSSLNESKVNDGKRRRSRSRSQSPYKRCRRKSSGSQTKERKSSETELPTELISNIQESAPISSSRLSHCEESFEDDPILNGLPDGFRSQLDDVQWMEFVSKLKTQNNRHRAEYDEYYQDPEMHDEYDQKRDSFMQMLEKENSNALQEEKDELWNQFWKVELNNCDEIKWKQWKNRFIKLTLKKTRNISNSNRSLVTPTSSKVFSDKDIHKKLASEEITVIDLEETVKVKSEPVDIVNTEIIKVKEEKMDSRENTDTRVKVENNIKIENDKTEFGTSIKNESSSYFDIPVPPLNFGSDTQKDPEAFLKDLDFLQNEYVAIGDEQEGNNSSETSTRIMSDTSESSGRLMNPEFNRSPSTSSSGRMRSPEFNFGEKQEFYLKKEKHFDEDYSTIKKQFVGHKDDSFLNVNTDKCMGRSEEFPKPQTDCLPNHQLEGSQNYQSEDFQNHLAEGLPNHLTNNENTGLTEQDINPKEKFKVKDALNTIQSISNRLPLLGPILNKFINKIKSQPTDSVKELEHLQDKNFLLLLGASATAFEKESERINDEIVRCLLDVGMKQALDLIKYAKSKQNVCVHGVNIENIAQRTIDKTAKECRQFIETAIMYETNSSDKPSEGVVKEIYSKISEMHYKMLSVRDANKGNVK